MLRMRLSLAVSFSDFGFRKRHHTQKKAYGKMEDDDFFGLSNINKEMKLGWAGDVQKRSSDLVVQTKL